MASGTILSQTRTTDAELPVENVTVAYYEPGETGKLRLLALRKSDASGQTPPVELETPPVSASQTPEQEGEASPFRTVSILADHPDFLRIRVEQVQVFDGVVTQQDLLLVPYPSPRAGEAPEEIIRTPGQNL